MSAFGSVIQCALRRAATLISRLRSTAFTLLSTFAYRGPAGDIAKLTLSLFRWRLVQLHSLNSCTDQVIELGPIGTSTIATPNFTGLQSVVQHGLFPAVKARVIKGHVLANTYSSAVLSNEKLLVPGNAFLNWRRAWLGHGPLFRRGDGFLVGRIVKGVATVEGILIGGDGAFNWYHFVIEVLPKAYLAQTLPDTLRHLPLLVPDVCRSVPVFAEALALYSGERTVHFFSNRDIILAKRIVVVDEISACPFNLAPGLWPALGDFRQHDELLTCFFTDFRRRVLSGQSISNSGRAVHRRIYLARPRGRRNYNQDELILIAARYGFDVFSAEDFSLSDQAKVFSESSFIIGPSGAAWVGLIFQDKPIRGLTWLPREYDEFCCYSSLANLMGHQLSFITANTNQALSSTGDGYLSAYDVCPAVFESALVATLENTA